MTQTELAFVRVPPPDTQCGMLIRAFREGRRLTVAEALKDFGIYALSQRVGELKEAGWPIRSETLKLHSGKRVSVYWMP